MNERPRRGEVWIAALDPTVGSEIRKTRPCLVVSPPEMERLNTVLVAPLSSQAFSAPSRIPTTFRNRPGLIVLDQLRAVDRRRFAQRVGAIDRGELTRVLETLQELFAP